MKLIKRIAPLFLLLLLSHQRAYAQSSEIVFTDTSSSSMDIGNRVFLYEDKTGKLELADILKLEHGFEKSNQVVPNYGVTKSVIWVRLDVRNLSSTEWMLTLGYPALERITLYYPENGEYKSKATGWSYPASERDLKAADFALVVPAGPRDSLLHYYLKAEAHIILLPMTAGKTDVIREEQHTNALYYLFYLGLVIMLFVYNLAIFITSRESAYLYYSTWVFFTILFFMIVKGYAAIMLPEQLSFIIHYRNVVSSLGGISIVFFVIATLRLKEVLPSILKWFYIMNGLYTIIIIAALLRKFQLAANLSQLVLILSAILGLTAGIMVYRRGHSFAKYYMYGFIATLLSMSIYMMIFQKVLTYNVITSNSILVGSGLEMILFSFGLGEKIKAIHREKQEAQALAYSALAEKEQLISGQNEILAVKVKERTQQLEREKKKSDDLLLNILPGEVAEELKLKGAAEAKLFDNVTVLFTDFVNFTGISESLSPKELVNEIHYCFRNFDEIIERNGLEKIKTIGDAYLAVCGLPNESEDHARRTVNAALEIREFVSKRKEQGGLFNIRIGVNSGSVVAGIVGIRKYAYDIWGDTVNLANRMEGTCDPGKINISGTTYEMVKDHFQCTQRGKIEVKNRGTVDMYFVEGVRIGNEG